MLSIPCPWCGPRDENEFSYGGEADLVRPSPSVSDREWAGYLFMRKNPKGSHRERWNHAFGCRQWFTLVRDTTTNQILDSSVPGAAPRQFAG